MEHFRAAERALASALVLGAADPRDLAGRVRASDFTDPAAGVVFGAALGSGSAQSLAEELPALLRRAGLLRQDGYPLSQVLDWLPRMPTPAHPEAWATLVVAGAIGRQVRASGERLQQSAEAAQAGRCQPGQLLALVAAQARRAGRQLTSLGGPAGALACQRPRAVGGWVGSRATSRSGRARLG
jgi:replicative DNA helicase